jgi:hypothetical protein
MKSIRTLIFALILSSIIATVMAAAPVSAEMNTNAQGGQTTGNNGVSSSGTTTINAGSSSYISGHRGFDNTTSTSGYGSTSLFGTYNNNDAPTAYYGTNTSADRSNTMRMRTNPDGVSNGRALPYDNRVSTYATDSNNDMDWGWLGLLGLIGLAGRNRKGRKV